MLSRSASNWFRADDGALRAPWQVAVFGASVAVAVFATGAVVLGALAGTGIESLARAGRIPLDQLALLAGVAIASVVTVRIARPGASALAAAGLAGDAWRPVPLVASYLVGTMVVSVPVGLLVLAGADRIVPSASIESWWSAAYGALWILVPASLSEELLFRGVAFSAVAKAIGARAAIAWTSLAFGLVHLFNPGPTIASVAGVIVAGAFLGIVRVVTGSLAAAWMAHLAINVTQALFFHASLSGVDLPMPAYRLVSGQPDWLTGGAWGPEGGLAVVAAMTVASLLLKKQETRNKKQEARSKKQETGNNHITQP